MSSVLSIWYMKLWYFRYWGQIAGILYSKCKFAKYSEIRSSFKLLMEKTWKFHIRKSTIWIKKKHIFKFFLLFLQVWMICHLWKEMLKMLHVWKKLIKLQKIKTLNWIQIYSWNWRMYEDLKKKKRLKGFENTIHFIFL